MLLTVCGGDGELEREEKETRRGEGDEGERAESADWYRYIGV